MSYKLTIGKIDDRCDGMDQLTRLHRLATALVNSDKTTIEEKRRILVVFAVNGYGCYAPSEVKEMLYLDAIAPHIPDGYELRENENCEWGIWPIKPATPVITARWPDWAEYAAMDSDDRWYWYEREPEIVLGQNWGSNNNFSTDFHITEYPNYKGDWKDSLVKNPNK